MIPVKLIRRITILCAFLCCICAKAGEADVERLLQLFEKQPTFTVASQFFAQLSKEQFPDEPVTLNASLPTDSLRQQVWYWAAEYFYDRQQYDKAEQYGLSALPLCKAGGNRGVEGDCLNILSLVYVRKGFFEDAAKYAKQCHALDLQNGDPDNISSSLNTLAAIYMSARQPQEAEKYILKGLEYSEKADNPQRKAVLLGMASEVYHHLHQEERSLEYATQAYEAEQKLKRWDKAAIRQAQRAASLISLKRYTAAKEALGMCIPEFRNNGNRHSLGIACIQMGLLLHQEKNDSLAVRYLNEALDIFVKQKDLFNESQTRKALYDALRKIDPAMAMEHNDRYNELRDSLYDRETGELLSKYAAEYGYEQLQAEHAGERNAHKRDLLIAVLLIIVLIIGLWLLNIAIRRRYQQRIEQLMKNIGELKRQEEDNRGLESLESGDDSQKTEYRNPETEDGRKDTEVSEEDRKFLLRTVEIVNEHLTTRNYGVETIASELNMSESTFRRRLLAVAGETPKAYISAIQMQKASSLLTSRHELSISDVAMQCGFEEASSFTRAFKRVYGVAPSQYPATEE